MRIWDIKQTSQSKFHGQHVIYDTEEEALKALNMEAKPLPGSQSSFKHWTDGQLDEWVRTDDGRIVKILSRKERTNKHGQTTLDIRVAWRLMKVWYLKDGTKRYKYLHADFFVTNEKIEQRNQYSGKVHFTSNHVRLFGIHYVTTFPDVMKAYWLTFPYQRRNTIARDSAIKKALRLSQHPHVKKLILNAMTNEKWREEILQAAEEAEFSMTDILKSIKEGLKTVAPGSKEHETLLTAGVEVLEKAKNVTLLREAPLTQPQITQDSAITGKVAVNGGGMLLPTEPEQPNSKQQDEQK